LKFKRKGGMRCIPRWGQGHRQRDRGSRVLLLSKKERGRGLLQGLINRGGGIESGNRQKNAKKEEKGGGKEDIFFEKNHKCGGDQPTRGGREYEFFLEVETKTHREESDPPAMGGVQKEMVHAETGPARTS